DDSMIEMPAALNKSEVDPNPIDQFAEWLDEALAIGISEQDRTSMTLATATKDGQPSARIVLLKSFDERGFVFFTNYHSRKGSELDENARASLLFYWAPLWRQVRIDGAVEKISEQESANYFQTRPLGSKLGAWASNQSEVIESRDVLERNYAELEKRLGENIPCPPHWGGYRVRPIEIEFWQGRENRLHDRLRYRLQRDGSWLIERLAP